MYKSTQIIKKVSATLFAVLANAMVFAQNNQIWNQASDVLESEVGASRPFITRVFKYIMYASILVGGAILIFGGERASRNAKIWAGGFMAGSVLIYVALSLFYN